MADTVVADAVAYHSNWRDRPRACQYCNKSKTKCIWPSDPGAGSCQRCMRLGRKCVLPEQGERRRRGPSTRVGVLEEKIDGIMHLLNASRQIQQQSQNHDLAQQAQQQSPASTQQSQSSPDNNQLPPLLYPTVEGGIERGGVTPPPPQVPISSLTHDNHHIGSSPARFSDYIEIVPSLRVSFDEAERLLELYRTHYSPIFPFVPVPRNISARDFLERQPFLFRTILQVVAPQNAAVQRDIGRWFREYVADHVVVNQEKRLELLQALVVFIGWGNFHYYMEARVTSLLQLAVGLVFELGLNKPPKVPSHIPNNLVDEARRVTGLRARPPHTLEDMRALLGCFYISSLVAALFRHVHMFPYSNYISTCCAVLENEQEFESDDMLVALVQIQRVMCRICSTMPIAEADDGPAEFTGSSYMAISCMRGELESVRRDTPRDIQAHWLFNTCYSGALFRLYEPVIYMRPISGYAEGCRRTESLWCCLDAARSFFEAYHAIPVEELAYLPFSAYSQFAFSIVTTTRLLFLNDSDWNVQLARANLDFHKICSRLGDSCDQADRVAAAEAWRRNRKFIDDVRPVMASQRDKLRWIGSWYLSKLLPANGDEPQPQPPGPNSNQNGNYNNNGMEVDGGAIGVEIQQMFSPGADFDAEWWQAVLDDMYNFGGGPGNFTT